MNANLHVDVFFNPSMTAERDVGLRGTLLFHSG